MSVEIQTDFEAGSIRVVRAEGPGDIVLELEDDNAASFRQWFYFAVKGAAGETLKITIRGISQSNSAAGLIGMPVMWVGYRALASRDGETWFPLDTVFDGEDLVATLPGAPGLLYVANWAPYTLERHRRLLERARSSPLVAHEVLGRTPDGLDLDCLRIGDPSPGKKVCWILARQHPAETQGSWCVEGLVERLLGQDPVAAALLGVCVFYVMPNMNPDGSRRGNTRTNAKGVNLNRTWIQPDPVTAPETALVKAKMLETGLDFGLDVHGWGGGHNFAVGAYNTPTVRDRQLRLWTRYEAALAAATEDFEVGWPYPGGGPKPGEADLSMSWNTFTEEFAAIGVLYELLYKDITPRAGPPRDWTPETCRAFGAATIDAIAAIADAL